MPTVFLSSTWKDLSEYRTAVIGAIRKLDGYTCICMEDFGARDWEADDFCRAKVRESDVFVGFLGHYYGSSPKGSERSFTEREYDEAVAASKPRLIFLAADNFPMPANLRESQTKWRKQLAFRQRASAERIPETFLQPEELALKVVQALRNHEQARKHVSYAEAEVAYRQHVIDKHGKLTLYSVTSDVPLAVDLERVFVKLTATQKQARGLTFTAPEGKVFFAGTLAPDDPELWKGFRAPYVSRELHLGPQQSEEKIVTLSLAEALLPREPLAIIGAPGAGKTTLLKYLALTFARNQAKERLQLDEERLPVFFALRDFNRFLNNLGKQGKLDGLSPTLLSQFLQQQTREHNPRLAIPDDFFAHALDHERCIVLLDGLDEVADPIERGRAAEAVALFARHYAGNRFLVTSRPRGYESEARARLAALCRECTIRDFDENDRAEFARSWYTAVTVDRKGDNDTARAEAQTAADDLLRTIKADDRITQLASNPLLLSILALVHQRGVGLPQRRVGLYEECTEMLLGYWDQVRGGEAARELATYGGLTRTEKRTLLEPIALWLHERGEAGLEVDAKCLEAQVAAQFRELFGDNEGKARERARLFLRVITERAGLLVEREQGVYAFAHLTFQEYLAARALADREDYVDYTLRHLHDPWWREVILLEVGHISSPNTRRSREFTTKLVRAIRNANSFLEDVLRRDLLLACRTMVDVSQLGLDEELRHSCFDELFSLWCETKYEPQKNAIEELFAYADPTNEGVQIGSKLRTLLNDKRSDMREQAASALGNMGPRTISRETLTSLIELSGDVDGDVRRVSATAVARIGTREMLPWLVSRLLELTRNPSNHVRGWAVDVLCELGSQVVTPAVQARLLELTRDESSEVHVVALNTLGVLASAVATSELLNHVLALSSHSFSSVRYAATFALGELSRALGASVLDRLLELTRDESDTVRASAAFQLGKAGASGAGHMVTFRLVELAREELELPRRHAAYALSLLANTSNCEATFSSLLALSKDMADYVRASATDDLGTLISSVFGERVVARLTELLRDQSPLVRASAVRAVGNAAEICRTPEMIARLLELTHDGSTSVRVRAAEALGKSGTSKTSDEVVSRLVLLMEDKASDIFDVNTVGGVCCKAAVSLGNLRIAERDAGVRDLLVAFWTQRLKGATVKGVPDYVNPRDVAFQELQKLAALEAKKPGALPESSRT